MPRSVEGTVYTRGLVRRGCRAVPAMHRAALQGADAQAALRPEAAHQLLFYKTLFDLTWARKKAMNASKRKSDAQPIPPHEPLAEDVERLANLEKQAAGALRASAFQNVELGHFFPSPV